MDRWAYDYYKSKNFKQAERDFMEFWLWSCANGYDIYKKDLKVAWNKYAETEFGISRGVKERYYGNSVYAEIARDVLNQYIIEKVGDSRKK